MRTIPAIGAILPRLFFMHFRANDDVGKLAKGLRSALDKVNLQHS